MFNVQVRAPSCNNCLGFAVLSRALLGGDSGHIHADSVLCRSHDDGLQVARGV
jgi:hypothetical protein